MKCIFILPADPHSTKKGTRLCFSCDRQRFVLYTVEALVVCCFTWMSAAPEGISQLFVSHRAFQCRVIQLWVEGSSHPAKKSCPAKALVLTNWSALRQAVTQRTAKNMQGQLQNCTAPPSLPENQYNRGQLISRLWPGRTLQTLRQRPTHSSLPWHLPGYRCSVSLWLVFTIFNPTLQAWIEEL